METNCDVLAVVPTMFGNNFWSLKSENHTSLLSALHLNDPHGRVTSLLDLYHLIPSGTIRKNSVNKKNLQK